MSRFYVYGDGASFFLVKYINSINEYMAKI